MKKILLWGVVGAVAGNVASVAQQVGAGADVAFTFGNLILPALPGVLATVAALLARSPLLPK